MTVPASITGAVQSLAALARVLADPDGTGTEELLAHALTLVCAVVPGARWASLTERQAHARTVAASHSRATILDELQYRTRSGPCLAALDSPTAVVSDFAAETRWPRFTELVLTSRLATASVSYPLTAVGHAATSLNLYTDLDGTKDHIDRQTGEVAVPLLAIVLTAVNQRHRLHHLAIGLATSRSIGAAIGVLMSRHHWTYDQAFEALRTASHDHHRRLRDIAADVVMTGDLPK